jgi:hypothetical protein
VIVYKRALFSSLAQMSLSGSSRAKQLTKRAIAGDVQEKIQQATDSYVKKLKAFDVLLTFGAQLASFPLPYKTKSTTTPSLIQYLNLLFFCSCLSAYSQIPSVQFQAIVGTSQANQRR